MDYKYGEFSNLQISDTKRLLRKKIYFLLCVAEDSLADNEYSYIDLYEAHDSVMWQIAGLNKLFGEPQEIVSIMSSLEEAKNIIKEPEFNFKKYRKLVLDAGAQVAHILEPVETGVC